MILYNYTFKKIKPVYIGLLSYLLLIIYASLYPFIPWNDIGIPMWSYISLSLPKYWLKFDLIINILGYIPLGIIGCIISYPIKNKKNFYLVIILFSILLSSTMEAIQTYIPNRIPSMIDLYTNVIGCFLGILVTHCFYKFNIYEKLLFYKKQWLYSPIFNYGIILIIIWLCIQIYPTEYLFEYGQLLKLFFNFIVNYADISIENVKFIDNYIIPEIIIVLTSLVSFSLLIISELNETAPKIKILFSIILIALTIKTLTTLFLFSSSTLYWFTPGAITGIFISILILFGFIFTSVKIQKYLAILFLIINLCVINIIPINPYYLAALQNVSLKQFFILNKVIEILSFLWPYLTLWYLFYSLKLIKKNQLS